MKQDKTVLHDRGASPPLVEVGNGRGRGNAGREVVWFSPHCINPVESLPLFAAANGNGTNR